MNESNDDVLEIRIIGTPNKVRTVEEQLKALWEDRITRSRQYPSDKTPGHILLYITIQAGYNGK